MNPRVSRALMAAAILIIGFDGHREATAAGSRRPSLFQTAPAASSRELLVRFEDDCAHTDRAAVLRRLGLQRCRSACCGTIEVVRTIPGQSASGVVKMLSQAPGVAYAEANDIAYALDAPDDPLFSYQWHLQDSGYGVHAPAAWARSRGAGVVVAVVDTGIAYANKDPHRLAPDLERTRFTQGYDFVNDDPSAFDDNGHGTHVAGVIAQSTGNKIGCAGVAPDATLMPVKVLDAQGAGKYDWIAEGIRFAADNGADVINLSLGGAVYSAAIHEAIQYALSKGANVLAAAGNSGTKGVTFPASLPEVIAVGAIRFDGTRAYYSNYGPELDLVAPGGDPRVDQNKDGYEDGILQQSLGESGPGTFRYKFMAGTSFAVAQAAGTVALLRAFRPTWSAAQVREALEKSAMPLGPAGRDDNTGFGAVNAENALNLAAAVPAAAPDAGTAPVAAPSSPAPSAPAPSAPAPAPSGPAPAPSAPAPTPSAPAPTTPAPVAPVTPPLGGGTPLISHDVLVTDVDLPAGVRRDNTARAIVTVANVGTEQEVVAVGLFDQTLGAWLRSGIVNLAPGQTGKVSFAWNVGSLLGPHTLVAYAILPGGTADARPGNNQKTDSLEVQKGLLALSVTPARPSFRTGDAIELTTQVRDILGPIAGAEVQVAMYAPGGYRIYLRTTVTDADGEAVIRPSRYSTRYGLGAVRVEITVLRSGYEPLTFKTSYEVTAP